MATALLSSPSLDGRDLSALRQISIGGAPAAPSLLAEVERRFGCEAICGYGMTESSPQLTKSLDKPGVAASAAKRATTGLPILGVDVRVLDDAGDEVPWDGVDARRGVRALEPRHGRLLGAARGDGGGAGRRLAAHRRHRRRRP